MRNKWNNRKLEEETGHLTEAAEKHNLKPIWEYRKKLRIVNTKKHTPLRKPDGTYTQNNEEILLQWTQWVHRNFHIPGRQKPTTQHIGEDIWGQIHKNTTPRKHNTNP